ncbi:MAG: hypothetical protein FXF54_01630 [Kosmotoga sp.]|nr:MAG: hypothetical protein FXF54_01630 [Kosmotoga sp.]
MMLPKEFRNTVIDRSIELLWNSWRNLGAWINVSQEYSIYSDPESAIVFSNYFDNFEPRLKVISNDWQISYSSYVYQVRLKRLKSQLSRLTGFMSTLQPEDSKSVSKNIGSLNTLNKFNLLPRLRLIFGLSSKAEVIFYLLTHEAGNSSKISRNRLLNQKAVYNELDKLSKANVVEEKRLGRERSFSLSKSFSNLFLSEPERVSVNWLLLSSAYLINNVLKDSIIDNEYLVFSAFMDHNKQINHLLQMVGYCRKFIKNNTAEELYNSVVSYYEGLFDMMK